MSKDLTESQKTGFCAGGSAIVSLKMGNYVYLRGGILGFGNDAEVISPKASRNQFMGVIPKMSNTY
jgi:hypothetical protein